MSRGSQRRYSVDDYFKVEEMSEVKHEFFDGEIFAMAGASLAQTGILVDHFQRVEASDWHLRSLHDRTGTIELHDLKVSLALEDVYRRVF